MKKLSLITSGLLLTSSLVMADIAIKPGWQMVGITEFSSPSTLFDNKCIDYIWKYDLKEEMPEWKVYIANGVDYEHDYNTFSYLYPGDSLWIKGNGTCTISIEESYEYHGKTYKSVTSPLTGRTWLDRNMGANQVCTAINDTECYGGYFQWGRYIDGHQNPTSATDDTSLDTINSFSLFGRPFITSGTSDWTTLDENGSIRNNSWANTTGTGLYGLIQGICPAGYRVPTRAELFEELGDETINDNTDLFNSFLKIPSSGYRSNVTGDILYPDEKVYLWVNEPTTNANAYAIRATTDEVITISHNRSIGFSVRCIKDY
jgi:uncharacterized protein (TIGR02145 family)